MRCLWITTGGITFLTFMFSVMVNVLPFPTVENRGVAFGIEIPEPLQTMLIVFALVIVMMWGIRARGCIEEFGFGCIIGGAFGNILDRLSDNMVTDIFRIGSFPLFNAADIAITVGVVIILWTEGRPVFRKIFTDH